MSHRDLYVLTDDHRARPAASLDEWAAFIEQNNCLVQHTRIDENTSISTVFRCMDLSKPSDEISPLLFESVVRGGRLDGLAIRYQTWHGAEAGHWILASQIQVLPVQWLGAMVVEAYRYQWDPEVVD